MTQLKDSTKATTAMMIIFTQMNQMNLSLLEKNKCLIHRLCPRLPIIHFSQDIFVDPKAVTLMFPNLI